MDIGRYMCVELSLLILKSATFVFEAGIFIVKEWKIDSSSYKERCRGYYNS